MKRWLVRIVVALAILEVVYVGAVNLVLNLPATQYYINKLNPDDVLLKWDRAWSWYPFRIHATNFRGSFQSWSQQWQITVPSVSASLALAPLISKTVQFDNMDGADLDLRFRPRPRPDLKDADVRQYYPTIEGRDPNSPAEPIPTQSPGWKLVFDISRVSGQHSVWIWGTKSTLAGEARATITHQGRHGPLAVSDGEADLTVKALSVDGQSVSNDGTLKASFDFASFVPYENRGLKALTFLTMDANIDLPVDGLDFLNSFLKKSTGMTVGGKGALKGRVVFDRGNTMPGTDLTVSADGLTVAQAPYVVDGSGTVAIAVAETAPKTLDAAFRFAKLRAIDTSDGGTLFSGENMQVTVGRPTYVLPGKENAKPSRVSLAIPMMTISDLSAYQRFLPKKWHVELLGGSGSIKGRAELSASKLDADLKLSSQDANVKFKEDSFETDLEFTLKAKGEASEESASVEISGTTLSLDDSRLKTERGDTSKPWKGQLSISTGKADFALPKASDPGVEGFWKLSLDKDIKAQLATLNGTLKANLDFSDLNWANNLIKSPYSLAFNSSAEVGADLTVRSGYLDKGSKLAMQPQKFSVEILDYVAEGNGGFNLTVEKGGAQPDLRFDASLQDASFRSQDEKKPVIDSVTLAVTANAQNVSLENGGDVTEIDLSIPSAKVNDMTAYNAYLPKGSPLRILSGTADLNAKVNLQKKSAGGFVKLKTSRIEADLDGERMSGITTLDVKINGGSAEEKTFDITGSRLTIDGVHVAGESAASASKGWNGSVDFGKSKVIWAKRASLDASLSVRMTDTRPLIEIFQANRKSHKWLDRILTLEDVRGNATISVKPNEFVVPYALAKSDTIDIGAKGFIRENDRQGMFYARYGALAGVLEYDNGEKKFTIIGATKKFDDYVPGGELPGMRASEPRRSEADKAQKGPLSIFKRK